MFLQSEILVLKSIKILLHIIHKKCTLLSYIMQKLNSNIDRLSKTKQNNSFKPIVLNQLLDV